MDDFGSGYSSFRYLYQLPFDTLKVDRSFLREVPNDPKAVSIIRGVLGLARSIGISVIAEGIETREQAECLASMGCQYCQGYYFERPVEPAIIALRYFSAL